MSITKIIIADDHAVVRRGIRLLIEDHDKFEILCEVSDGQEALNKCKELNPDVLVSDISMPKISGLELVKILRVECPTTKVLFLSMYQEADYVIKAFKNGAYGYLHKGVAESEITSAIEEIAKNQKYYSAEIARILATNLSVEKSDNESIEPLTKREKEIVEELINGLNNKEIAEKLFISVRTVDSHRSNILQKLEVKNTAALVSKVLKNNLLD